MLPNLYMAFNLEAPFDKLVLMQKLDLTRFTTGVHEEPLIKKLSCFCTLVKQKGPRRSIFYKMQPPYLEGLNPNPHTDQKDYSINPKGPISLIWMHSTTSTTCL